MITREKYIEYFQGLVDRWKGEEVIHFEESIEALKSGVSKDQQGEYVFLGEYPNSNFSEGLMRKHAQFAFYIVRAAKEGNDEGKAYDEAYQLAVRFLGKMQHDHRTEDGIMRYLDSDSVNEAPAPQIEGRHGIAVRFDLRGKSEIKYNQEDFED